MSGFEVVGVILGVYPIVVEGIKLYQSASSGEGFTSLANDFEHEEIQYSEHVGRLFGVDYVCRKRTSGENGKPGHPILTAHQQENLESRLGKDKTKSIRDTLEEISGILESIRCDISNANPGRGFEAGGYDKIRGKFRIIRFIRRKSSFRDRLNRLRQCNERLKYYLEGFPLPKMQSSRRQVMAFPRHDGSALDIYDAIFKGYRCHCNVAHSARLCVPELQNDTFTADTECSFLLLFPFADNFEPESLAMGSQTHVDGDVKETQFADEDSGPTSPFRRLSIMSSSTTTQTTTTTNSSLSSSRSKLSRSRSWTIKKCTEKDPACIEDLCSTVHNSNAPAAGEQLVGLLSSTDKIFELRNSNIARSVGDFGETINLEDLMNFYQEPMFRKYRLALALRLSYAVLQFYSTPWIDDAWSWRDFTTVINGGRPQNGDPLFISHSFYSSRKQISSLKPRTALSFGLWAGVGEEMLTRLGFALIELGVGKRLSEIRQDGSIKLDPRMKVVNDPDILDFWTSEGVLEAGLLSEHQGDVYEEVVRVLIKHEFMEGIEPQTLSSTGARKMLFRRDVEQLIIAPLYAIFNNSWRKPQPE